MDNMTIDDLSSAQQRAAEILRPLIYAYPHANVKINNIIVYAVALSALSEAELQAGVLKVMRTCRFFPTIFEIMEASRDMVEAATGNKAKDDDEAWQEVQEAVRYTLAFREPEFSTQDIKQAVDTIGWKSFVECEVDNINTLRSQFLRIYESICKRRRDKQINSNVIQLMGAKTDKLIQQLSEGKSL